MKYLVGLIIFVFTLACNSKIKDKPGNAYNGPIMQVDNVNLSMSDSGRVRVKVSTAQELTYINQDKKYPKAVFVNFIDKTGAEYSSLRGDSAKYTKVKNLYLIQGNVFFFNRVMQQSMATEELYWNPTEKKIYSKKKVTIKTPRETLVAAGGMESNEDFSKYTLVRPKGVFMVDSIKTMVDTTTKK